MVLIFPKLFHRFKVNHYQKLRILYRYRQADAKIYIKTQNSYVLVFIVVMNS